MRDSATSRVVFNRVPQVAQILKPALSENTTVAYCSCRWCPKADFIKRELFLWPSVHLSSVTLHSSTLRHSP